MQTAIDPAFQGAGEKPGTLVWRIENFSPVLLKAGEYGKFYDGDCYIILNTKQRRSGALEWSIHFWLGKNSSQDEKGTAAIKAIELDDLLGGSAVQHRETMEHESQQFVSYFKGGIRYAEGGVKSGFKHVDPNKGPVRLFHVKGKRNVRVREVQVSVKSMNKGDCFILDTPNQLFVYVGRYSKKIERFKALQAAKQIRDQDHGGRLKVKRIEPNSPPEDVAAFFVALGGGCRDDLADPPKEDDDETYEKMAQKQVILYRVSDASGKMTMEKVGERPLRQKLLDHKDCFILDAGKSGIYVWTGKGSTKEEKVQALKKAEDFLTQNNYPNWTKIRRVIDGGEPPAFKQYFKLWKEPDETPMVFGTTYTVKTIEDSKSHVAPKISKRMTKEEMKKMLKHLGKALGFCPDDGKGQMEVFRIKNFELSPVSSDQHGIFFGGDSYVIRYKYYEKNRENYIIYYWQGRDSTQDEKAAAAIHAVRLDEEVFGKAVQVRVLQGHEPAHFLRMFKGRMVIYKGGHSSGFRNVREHDTYDPNESRLFHIKGTCEDDLRAVEVDKDAESLDSEDVFILDGPASKSTYMWIGKGATEDEINMAKQLDKIVSPDRTAQMIKEGSETQEFWDLIGGKRKIAEEESNEVVPLLDARLFHCTLEPGSDHLEVEEVHDFTQEDLNEDDVMVLDTGDDEIFIWVGKGASKEEKDKSMHMAEDYIQAQHERQGGNAITVSILVKQGEEPDAFKALFPNWQEAFIYRGNSLDQDDGNE